MGKKITVIGMLGTVTDAAKSVPDRWNRWRPTVSIFQHEDFVPDKLVLLHDGKHQRVAEHVMDDVALVAPETECQLWQLPDGDPWDFATVYAALQDFALAYPFDTEREDYLVHITTGTHVAQICMFLLTEARYLPARLLQTAPWSRAVRFPGNRTIVDLDLSKYDQLAQRFEAERSDAASYLKGGIETRNAAFNAMIDRIEQVAIRSDAPLLLLGETGTGKSRLARRIYDLKKLRHAVDGDFVEINCATLRGEQAMSVLFGHKRGFGGSSTERRGLLRAADGGVLFLDEIDELGPDEQAVFLDAIEHGRFYPEGSDRPVETRFQLIAGASKDLRREVREGRFRPDLFARLNLWTFALPALKDRREDIEPNLEAEIQKLMRRGEDKISFAADAWRRYVSFAADPASAWTGNFRDLSASATRMATLSARGRITTAIVDEEIDRLTAQWAAVEDNDDLAILQDVLGADAAQTLDRFDQAQLAEVIRVCRHSKSMSEAGKKLFAQSRLKRKTQNDSDRVKKYLARFGLGWADVSA